MTRDLLRLAQEAYEALAEADPAADPSEPGIAPGLAWQVHLQKGCRFLAAARHCLMKGPRPGFYTGAMELAFCSMERTLQAHLMHREGYRGEDFRAHLVAFRESGTRGILEPDVARALEDLWVDFRNENYYREGIPGRSSADRIVALASELHLLVARSRPAYRGVCSCPKGARV